MAILHDRDFGKNLCNILGLDPKKTRDIIIKCLVDDVVMVEVTQYLQDTEAKELLEVLEKYELHKKL